MNDSSKLSIAIKRSIIQYLGHRVQSSEEALAFVYAPLLYRLEYFFYSIYTAVFKVHFAVIG